MQDKELYCWSVRESLKTMLSWGWSIDRIREGDPTSLHNKSRRISQASQVDVHTQTLTLGCKGYSYRRKENSPVAPLYCISFLPQLSFEGAPAFTPRPIDMSNVTLSRDMQVG